MLPHYALLLTLLAFLLASGSAVASEAPHVKIVAGSMQSGTLRVWKGTDAVTVQSREFEVQIELPNRQSVSRFVSVLYDPATLLLWWNADSTAATAARRKIGESVLLPHDSIICLTNSKFVLFWNGWTSGGRVLIRESAERYPSFEKGLEHVLLAIAGKRDDIEAGEFIHAYKEVQFSELNRDFLFARNVANRVGPTLREVRRVANEWHIVEDSPNGGSAVIVLNDQYQVLKTTILPSK